MHIETLAKTTVAGQCMVPLRGTPSVFLQLSRSTTESLPGYVGVLIYAPPNSGKRIPAASVYADVDHIELQDSSAFECVVLTMRGVSWYLDHAQAQKAAAFLGLTIEPDPDP